MELDWEKIELLRKKWGRLANTIVGIIILYILASWDFAIYQLQNQLLTCNHQMLQPNQEPHYLINKNLVLMQLVHFQDLLANASCAQASE